MKQFRKDNLAKDILAGIIVALVSIPIAMGYAQVAGLPVVYGLYGSIFPILVYSFVTSSPQFVFGVDATPAALVGGALAGFGVVSGSQEAMELVPLITVVTAGWLLIFFFIRAGKLVNYISTAVMGGFISGIGCTIILMQVSKLFGGVAGTGELLTLVVHISRQLPAFNILSAVLGFGTVIIILVAKKYIPKFPMSVVLMGVGAALTYFFKIDQYGVALLPTVEAGLPRFILPNFSLMTEHGKDIIVLAFTIALVVVAQTLLATNNYALKYNYKISNNREILAYAAGNMAGGLVGCCPINGSVSRAGIGDQYGAKSQVMSVAASVTMVLVLLFGTELLSYLPVPVLTGIVIAALIGIIEFKIAKKLWKSNKQEFFIFLAAFMGVLLLGTIYGVIIGVLLSFIAVIIRAVIPPRAFVGIIPGHEGMYTLSRHRDAKSIEHTVIYRFSGNLFFANINTFQQDIEAAIKVDTRQVIVDARGIGEIDITAADRLQILHRNLREKGIHFYITEHAYTVNDQLRMYGAGNLIEEGVVRRTISLALRAAGVEKPYPLEGVSKDEEHPYIEEKERLAEFEWAFGEGAEEKMEEIAREMAERLVHTANHSIEAIEEVEDDVFEGRFGLYDEDELLERLEMHLEELEEQGVADAEEIDEIEESIEKRRKHIEKKIARLSPEALDMFKEHREEIQEHIKEHNPDMYKKIEEVREQMEK